MEEIKVRGSVEEEKEDGAWRMTVHRKDLEMLQNKILFNPMFTQEYITIETVSPHSNTRQHPTVVSIFKETNTHILGG